MSSSEEPEPDMEQANKKKVRGESSTPSVDASEARDRPPTPLAQTEAQEVKEVTQGVKDVELEVGSAPESVPLPDEESDELEESSSNVTPPPEAQFEHDEVVDESVSGKQQSHQDEPEATDETTVAEKVTVLKTEMNGRPVVVEGDVNVTVATAGVAKSEPSRNLRSKTKDSSTATA